VLTTSPKSSGAVWSGDPIHNAKKSPSLRAIKARTDHVLNAACLLFNLKTRVEPLDNKLELRGDLSLEKPRLRVDNRPVDADPIKALAIALSTISLGHGGEPVSTAELGECVTVGDIAAVVHRRAGGPKGPGPKGSGQAAKKPKPAGGSGKIKKS